MIDYKLVVKIENSKPLELIGLTLSLMDLGQLYNEFLKENEIEEIAEPNPLYIKQLKTGSIEIELFAYLGATIPLISNFNNIVQFGKYLKDSYYYFLGKVNEIPHTYKKKDLDYLYNILNPIIEDNDSKIHFEVKEGAVQNNYFHFNSEQSNAIQNKINHEKEKMEVSLEKQHYKQLLVWYQTKFDEKSTTGNKAIIENIHDKPVKVIFEEDLVKKQMTRYDENLKKDWQRLAYIGRC